MFKGILSFFNSFPILLYPFSDREKIIKRFPAFQDDDYIHGYTLGKTQYSLRPFTFRSRYPGILLNLDPSRAFLFVRPTRRSFSLLLSLFLLRNCRKGEQKKTCCFLQSTRLRQTLMNTPSSTPQILQAPD